MEKLITALKAQMSVLNDYFDKCGDVSAKAAANQFQDMKVTLASILREVEKYGSAPGKIKKAKKNIHRGFVQFHLGDVDSAWSHIAQASRDLDVRPNEPDAYIGDEEDDYADVDD